MRKKNRTESSIFQSLNVFFRPIVFSMDGDSSYEGNFVLATLVDNESSAPSSQQSCAEVEAAASKSTKKDQKGKQDKR